MPRQRLYTLVAGVAALVLALLAVAVLGTGNNGDAEDSGSGAGLVIIDGERLQPPFVVTADGATVLINGEPAASFAPVEYVPAPVSPEADNNVFQVVEQVRLEYLQAGGGDSGVAAAIDMLSRHPAAPVFEERAAPHAIAVTMADGSSASFRIETPDADIRAVDAAHGEQQAAETAGEWRALLDDGGGVVASTRGVTITIPASEVGEFLESLDEALSLSGSARDSALFDLLGAPELVEDHGGAPPALEQLSHRLAPAGMHHVGLQVESRAPAESDQLTGPGHARTPGKKEAYVLAFTKLDASDARPFSDALVSEGYRVWWYRNPATILAFAATSRTGALYNVTHSTPTSISVAIFDSDAAASAEFRRMQAAEIPRSQYEWWKDDDGVWWLDLTHEGIRAYWQSNDTIVHSASCEGVDLAPAFNAREFFAYVPEVSCAITLPDTRLLWGRWSGVIGDGEHRSANRAFAQGGFHEDFRHITGNASEDTVLSPSVILEQAPDIAVGAAEQVIVGFDAVMRTSVAADLVVDVEGCAAPVAAANWNFDAVIMVAVRANEPGTYTVRVNQAFAHSPALIYLDGNQTPNPGPAGVAPNRDDHLFEGSCVAAATDDSGVDLRTPTPMTDGPTVEVIVLVIDGEHYPAIQFITALPDACEEDHYHAGGPVRSLEGSEIVDPNPPGCGFGATSEIPSLTVQWPEEEYEAWREATGN